MAQRGVETGRALPSIELTAWTSTDSGRLRAETRIGSISPIDTPGAFQSRSNRSGQPTGPKVVLDYGCDWRNGVTFHAGRSPSRTVRARSTAAASSTSLNGFLITIS
jgi:hypothetical protein